MKKQLFAVIGLVLSSAVYSQQKDPVLLEINGKPVTKSEFLQIYLKNNNEIVEERQQNINNASIKGNMSDKLFKNGYGKMYLLR